MHGLATSVCQSSILIKASSTHLLIVCTLYLILVLHCKDVTQFLIGNINYNKDTSYYFITCTAEYNVDTCICCACLQRATAGMIDTAVKGAFWSQFIQNTLLPWSLGISRACSIFNNIHDGSPLLLILDDIYN